MYVAGTRAKDRLHFSESEGFNVQNSQSKYPSRFIREARDDFDGYCYYDIDGPFDESLWMGTDRLMRALENPDGKSPQPFPPGSRVHHAVFGDGVVEETEGDGTVTVRFEGFGQRRLNPSYLTGGEPDD